MATSMHRLQVCLPESQIQYLTQRSRKEGVSLAELIRRLVDEAAKSSAPNGTESLWEIAGIGEESGSLINGIPVSERPELYLSATLGEPQARTNKKIRKRRKTR